MSGISAVSPPINLQSEISQPLKIPFKILLVFLNLIYQLQCSLEKIMVLRLALLSHSHTSLLSQFQLYQIFKSISKINLSPHTISARNDNRIFILRLLISNNEPNPPITSFLEGLFVFWTSF